MKIIPKVPFLLYSYLATEMLAPFFATFIILNAVFFLVKLIPFLNFVLKLQVDLADFTRLLAYLFPSIFLYTLPMSAMLGITICFSRLSSDLEILSLKAGGISIYKIMPSVLIVSSLIALLTGYFSIQLIPKSELAMKQLSMEILKENITKGIKENSFSDALGKVVLYIQDIDDDDNWHNIWISDSRQKGQPTIITAKTGHMSNVIGESSMSVILNQGQIHKSNSKNKSDIIEFASYQINMPLQKTGGAISMANRKYLTLSQLYNTAAEQKAAHKKKWEKYLIEFHKRLTLPLGCLMLSFLALPLGLQARAGRKAIGIPISLGIFITYYLLYTVGKEVAGDHVPVALAMWFPNFLFLLLAIFWTHRVSNEKELFPKIFQDAITKIPSLFRRKKSGNI